MADDVLPQGNVHTDSLSVIIPVYNGESSLGAAIASAWAAGASEVIVIDDGSSDSSAQVAEELGCAVFTQTNAGAAQARRLGVRHAHGQYVALLDADDELIAAGVRESMNLARSTHGWSVIIGVTIGVTGSGGRTIFQPWLTPVTPVELIRRGFSPCPPAALLWNRTILSEAMFDSTPAVWPRFAEDYELLIRGSMKGAVLTHSQPSALYALEGGKSTHDPSLPIQASESIRQNYAKLLGLKIRVRGRRAIRSRALLRMAKMNDGPTTQDVRRKLIAKSFLLDPPFMAGFLATAVWRRIGPRGRTVVRESVEK